MYQYEPETTTNQEQEQEYGFFKGRLGRLHTFLGWLILAVAGFIINTVVETLTGGTPGVLSAFSGEEQTVDTTAVIIAQVISIAVSIPLTFLSMSMLVRRLQDFGASWVWAVVYLILSVASIPLAIFTVLSFVSVDPNNLEGLGSSLLLGLLTLLVGFLSLIVPLVIVLIPGNPDENEYGPPTEGSRFSLKRTWFGQQ